MPDEPPIFDPISMLDLRGPVHDQQGRELMWRRASANAEGQADFIGRDRRRFETGGLRLAQVPGDEPAQPIPELPCPSDNIVECPLIL